MRRRPAPSLARSSPREGRLIGSRGGPLQHVIKNLVRTPNCKIDRCSCGAVHVSVGSVTLRITEDAARELRDALNHALASGESRQSFAPTPAIHLVDTRGDEDPEDGGPQLH